MDLRIPAFGALLLAAGTAGASADPCQAGGVLPSCQGELTRSSQPYRFGARRPALVKAGRPVAAQTRYCFGGESRIGRKTWFYVDSSDLMFDATDVALPNGCKLSTLDTSEPD